MPYYFPENNTPSVGDPPWRSLQKIVDLSGSGGSGGVQVVQSSSTAAPADPTKPALRYPPGGGTLSQWDVATQAWVSLVFMLTLMSCMFGAHAANPAFNDFAPTQFSTNAAPIVIKSGASVTNFQIFAFTNTGSALFINGLSLSSGTTLDWNGDLFLQRDANNTLAQRNGTTAQTNLIYNTWSNDGTDYERGFVRFSGNVMEIGMETAGSGTVRNVNIVRGGTTILQIANSSTMTCFDNLVFSGDSVRDIGASGSTRPRSLYLGGNITVGTNVFFPKTITAAGTTGAQTINKISGSVNFAAAAQTLVVTDSLVDANSVITATVATDDATALSVKAIPAAGSFTLKLNAAATAETRVNWHITN